jgi:hypothetical protein
LTQLQAGWPPITLRWLAESIHAETDRAGHVLAAVEPGRNHMGTDKSEKIRSYAELMALIRRSLRTQNPQWIDANGQSPICDEYEARFANLLGLANSSKDHRAKA